MTISLLCPNCGSNQTQSVDAIHSSGTSVGSARTTSFGTDYNGNFSQSSGVTSYGSSTLLATRVAPPKRPAYPSLSWAFCVLSVMGGIFLFWAANAQGTTRSGMNTLRDYGTGACFIAIIFGIYAIIKTMNANENMPTWETDYSRWSKQRFCFSCSNIYTHRREFSSDTSSVKQTLNNINTLSPRNQAVNLAADSVEIKIEGNTVTFTQPRAIGSRPCTVSIGLVGEVKKRVGYINATISAKLDNGEYAFDIEVDGIVYRSGVFRIGEIPKSFEVTKVTEKINLDSQKQNLDSTVIQLKQAGEMFKEGLLSKEEFDKIKDKLIQQT